MTNHPNHSRHMRTVTLKISAGGRMVACHPESTDDLCMRVTDVPASVSSADVATKLGHLSWLPFGGGPWAVAWERVADAPRGAIIKDCADMRRPGGGYWRQQQTPD